MSESWPKSYANSPREVRRAYQEGKRAFYWSGGDNRPNDPYPRGTETYNAFEHGWSMARKYAERRARETSMTLGEWLEAFNAGDVI
jgi:hypothetical protein